MEVTGYFKLEAVKKAMAPDLPKKWGTVLVYRNKAATVWAVIYPPANVAWFLPQEDGSFTPIPETHEAVTEARAAEEMEMRLGKDSLWVCIPDPPDALYEAWQEVKRARGLSDVGGG